MSIVWHVSADVCRHMYVSRYMSDNRHVWHVFRCGNSLFIVTCHHVPSASSFWFVRSGLPYVFECLGIRYQTKKTLHGLTKNSKHTITFWGRSIVDRWLWWYRHINFWHIFGKLWTFRLDHLWKVKSRSSFRSFSERPLLASAAYVMQPVTVSRDHMPLKLRKWLLVQTCAGLNNPSQFRFLPNSEYFSHQKYTQQNPPVSTLDNMDW